MRPTPNGRAGPAKRGSPCWPEEQVEAGDLEGAMETQANLIEEFRPRTLIAIARAHERAGRREAALDALRLALAEVDRRPEITGPDSKVEILARMGEFGRAAAALAALEDRGRQGQVVGDLAEIRAASGDVEGTLAWALSFDPGPMRVWAFQGMARGIRLGRRLSRVHFTTGSSRADGGRAGGGWGRGPGGGLPSSGIARPGLS